MVNVVKKRLGYVMAAALILLAAAVYYVSNGIAQTSGTNPGEITIRGRVVSTYGPVENARVRMAGEEKYTLTDRDGRYELVASRRSG